MTWTSISDQSSSWSNQLPATGVIFLVDELTGALLVEEDSDPYLIDETAADVWTPVADQDTTWS